MSRRPVKICFVSLNSYPLFLNKSTGYFGGAEVQMSLIAKAISKDKDFRVSLVAGDYGQTRLEKKAGVTIYKCFDNNNYNLIGLFKFIKTLKEINADVYVDRTMGPKLGMIGLFGLISKKKVVYMVAHDWDCSFEFKNYLKGIVKWFYYCGLKRVDQVVSQNINQQKKLLDSFNVKSLVIKSVIKPVKQKEVTKRFVLWVGRADKWKQPEKMIELARKLKSESVVMICRQGGDLNYFDKIKMQAQAEPSIKFLPVVSFEEIIKIFAQAKVLINTSEAEGFPNTFLQAGLTKTPVLSLTVNPDGYLNKYKCGYAAGNSLNRLVAYTKKILKNPSLRRKMGENHLNYIKKHHSMRNITKFKQLIVRLCSA